MDDVPVISLVVTGIVFGAALFSFALWAGGQLPRQIKQQAFDRGYMVECVGKTGYYWECAK